MTETRTIDLTIITIVARCCDGGIIERNDSHSFMSGLSGLRRVNLYAPRESSWISTASEYFAAYLNQKV